jgi:uncharacterized membrane protein YoaK (UPF0700 family)
MTGTTTQIMIDIADLTRGIQGDGKEAAQARLAKMTAAVVAFAVGCAGAALLYAQTGVYCFLVPPLLGIATLLFRMTVFPGDVR